MISRIVVDSSDAITDLCSLGQKFGTDKSPYNTVGHRHPYTAVYSMLFSPLRAKPIRFAEIGIAGGASALLWDAYFTHPDAQITMFDRDTNFMANADSMTGPRVKVGLMDVAVDGDVRRALSDMSSGEEYDVIIDDSSHDFDHQIRIVKEAWPLLKTGGMLIVEDIFRARTEDDYARELENILTNCASSYFVMCEHKYKWSPGWDNDKLLVLVKA
jgi:predicted O-methyltransferase YrrM